MLISPSSFLPALLVNLHHPASSSRSNDVDNDRGDVGEEDEKCGVINSRVVQQVLAAKWAIEVINNRSLDRELKIGKHFNNDLYTVQYTLLVILRENL